MKQKNIFQFIALVLFATMVITSCTSTKTENLNVENASTKRKTVLSGGKLRRASRFLGWAVGSFQSSLTALHTTYNARNSIKRNQAR